MSRIAMLHAWLKPGVLERQGVATPCTALAPYACRVTAALGYSVQLFDVLAAATYLAQALEPSIAIIVFITVGSYIPLTIAITEWRGKLRREMNQTDQVGGMTQG